MHWSADTIADALRSRVRVAITFHYTETRLTYLADVLTALAMYPVAQLDIFVFTNTSDAEELKKISSLYDTLGISANIITADKLEHPYDLTWSHKPMIKDWCESATDTYSHFIYIEDDERLTFENFVYFLGARKQLAPYGLIPGFVRYEWSVNSKSWFVLDSTEEISLSKRAYVETNGEIFISLKQPYCGCFVLDKELGSEYVITKSFDRNLSETCPWGVRERSAAGLTWENVPGGFHSRKCSTRSGSRPVIDGSVAGAVWS